MIESQGVDSEEGRPPQERRKEMEQALKEIQEIVNLAKSHANEQAIFEIGDIVDEALCERNEEIAQLRKENAELRKENKKLRKEVLWWKNEFGQDSG